MQRSLQDFAAEGFPVVARVDQMQVPDLIDILAGGHRMPGCHGQKDKAPVLVDHPTSMTNRPTILPGESCREGQLRLGIIQPVPENS